MLEMSCIDDQIENAHSRKEAIDAEKEKSRLKSLNNLTESLREADKRRAKHLNEIAHPPKTKF